MNIGLKLLKYLGYNLSPEEETAFKQIWEEKYKSDFDTVSFTKLLYSIALPTLILEDHKKELELNYLRKVDFEERLERVDLYKKLESKSLEEITSEPPHIFLVAKKDSEEIRQRMLEQLLI